jgi:signal transduction histidine kinase
MDARIQADEANRAKSVFLTTMSHELRTPLNHILGYTELLEETAIEEGRKDSLPDLAKIKSSGKHLLGLIQGILDFTNLEAGRMDLRLETFDLHTLVQEIENEVRSRTRIRISLKFLWYLMRFR